jgi:hypothetical protein
MDKKIVKIGEAAKILGMSNSTLRRWEKLGKLLPVHTSPGGFRFYDVDQIKATMGPFVPVEVPTDFERQVRRDLVFAAWSGGHAVKLDEIEKIVRYVVDGKR